MKAVLVVIFALLTMTAHAEPQPKPTPWVQLSELYVSAAQVRMYGPNSYADPQPWTGLYYRGGALPDPYPSPALQTGVVYTQDLAAFGVPTDAKAAFLSGILIVTNNTGSSEYGQIRVTFARHGDPIDCTKYIGQAFDQWENGNMRSNMATWVPLADGKFDYCIIVGAPNVPYKTTYGINLMLQAWGR